MTIAGGKLPYVDTDIAKLLRDRIDALAPQKSQREIANEVGYEKPNVLSMYKRGEAKVPMDRLPGFARALGVDLIHLFKLWIRQGYDNDPEIQAVIINSMTPAWEAKLLVPLREVLGETDWKLSSDELDLFVQTAEIILEKRAGK